MDPNKSIFDSLRLPDWQIEDIYSDGEVDCAVKISVRDVLYMNDSTRTGTLSVRDPSPQTRLEPDPVEKWTRDGSIRIVGDLSKLRQCDGRLAGSRANRVFSSCYISDPREEGKEFWLKRDVLIEGIEDCPSRLASPASQSSISLVHERRHAMLSQAEASRIHCLTITVSSSPWTR